MPVSLVEDYEMKIKTLNKLLKKAKKRTAKLQEYASINTYKNIKLEEYFTEILLKTNIRFERQLVLGNYIVDFGFSDRLLIVELYEDYHKKQKKYDEKRIKQIKSWGFNVLIFKEEEVYNNIKFYIDKILSFKTSEQKEKLHNRKVCFLQNRSFLYSK